MRRIAKKKWLQKKNKKKKQELEREEQEERIIEKMTGNWEIEEERSNVHKNDVYTLLHQLVISEKCCTDYFLLLKTKEQTDKRTTYVLTKIIQW